MKVHPLVEEILENGKQKTWIEYAKKYKIKKGKDRVTRAKAANDIWRGYKRKRNLHLVKETTNGKGDVLFRTTKERQEPEFIDTTGLKITKVTTNPHGKPWIQYSIDSDYGISPEDFKLLQDSFEPRPIGSTTNIVPNNEVITVDISDLHSGAVLKALEETIITQEYNTQILIDYLEEAIDKINGYEAKEVHLFIPGDIVETFTAFNHRDTWKKISNAQGGIVIIAYEVMKKLITEIDNLKKVYLIEGNHDRLTSHKEGNSRKGLVEVLAYFLSENSSIDIKYHPFLVAEEIDGIYHICTHGDLKPFKRQDSFFFKYGKQGIFNVLKTGHYHGFNIINQSLDFLHYQCPSIFTGNFFSESIGFNCLPAFTVVRSVNGLPHIEYVPLHGKRDFETLAM